MIHSKSIVIIILNFNGYKDTIECLSSISKIDYPLFNILLIDNGSTDGSVEKIFDWSRHKFMVNVLDSSDMNKSPISKGDSGTLTELSILKNSDNRGFAAGCNQGMELALSMGVDYIWLLNNDTTVEADSLSVLAGYLERDPSCHVTTPQIRLYDEPDKVWNCGGQLKWYGVRQYFFVHSPISELPKKETLDITFVTGCAPLIRTSLIKEEGMFTDKFFFGEEDFDFSLRMKDARKKMVCCLLSVIYHKVGASIDDSSDEKKVGKAYVYYLNRFINLRNYWPGYFWHCWRGLYGIYIYILLGKQTKYSSGLRRKFIKKLFRESSSMDGVDKQTFLKIIHSNINYF